VRDVIGSRGEGGDGKRKVECGTKSEGNKKKKKRKKVILKRTREKER